MDSARLTLRITLREKTRDLGKFLTLFFSFNTFFIIQTFCLYLMRDAFALIIYRLSFLKFASKYFETELCMAKIKVDERIKKIAFDAKNNRLTVMSYDRVLYFFDIPKEQIRYIPSAEVRTF